jgi:hypothetical protein
MEGTDIRSTWQWATVGVQKDFASAYADFRLALAQAFPSPEAARRVNEAYVTYATALDESWRSSDLASRVSEIGATYRSAVQEALSGAETRANIHAAFRQYVAATQAAWAAADIAEIQPEDLVTIAQSMAWIASIAADIRRDASV